MTIEKLLNIKTTKPVTDDLLSEFHRAIEAENLSSGCSYASDQQGFEIDGSIYLHAQDDVSPMQAVFRALSTLPWIREVIIRDFTLEDLE